MTFIQSFASPAQTAVMSAVSILGEEMLMISIMAFLFLCYDKQKGRVMSTGLIVALLGGMIMKSCFMRRRPYFDNPGIKCLRAPSGKGDVMNVAMQGYSFPSMHSADSVVIAGNLFSWFRKRWVRVLCIVFPLLVGFSRVYLGVHYPTDVIVGWLTGLLAFAVTALILKKTDNWLLIFILCTILSLPGWFVCKANDFFSVYGLMAGTLLGFFFEDKCVHFSNTKNPWRAAIRLIVALAIFLGLSKGLKLPFSKEFLGSGSFWAHLACSMRYAISAFAVMGLYPILFRHTDKLFNRSGH